MGPLCPCHVIANDYLLSSLLISSLCLLCLMSEGYKWLKVFQQPYRVTGLGTPAAVDSPLLLCCWTTSLAIALFRDSV